MEFKTRVNGIPCICCVDYYTPYKPMKITGSGFGDCEPPEEEEFEFHLKDRKGYKANWLEAMLTPNDEERLLRQFKEISRHLDP